MRESFKEQLETYTDAINTSFEDLTKEGKVHSEERKQELVNEAAERNNTTNEAETEVYRIQKLKIEKLRKFKRWLESTRSGGEGFVHPQAEKDRPKVSAAADGTLSVEGRGLVTMGELIADVEWGQKYAFDKSVNIHDIRKWHLAQLKDDLRDKLNAQIITSEIADRAGDAWKQEAYVKMKERSENEIMEQRGVIAEKMVASFLQELAYDCPEADFTVEPADAYEDVHEKIDFIIHRKERAHGARIEEGEENEIRVRDVGVQFTTALGKTEQKQKQIKRARQNQKVDDIVLVTLPLRETNELYKKWEANGHAPGGPMRYWSRDTKAQVFRAVMTHVLSGREIDEFCDKYF